ncbi:MAG: phosphatase PAP2 family protein [Verrucomicrobia bacterium]|nr:phosphatase PAP2 family protein [Verrucomicrobiota bacterium]
MNHALEMQWIQALHSALRVEWLDQFFRLWDFVDTGYFAILIITCVWYLWDRKIGIRLFYLMIFSLMFNQILKGLFEWPRPCQVDPMVGILCHPTPGFPSGAAQSAVIYAGVVILECKRWLWRFLALGFAFLLCFSRVYLGVHYPSDILGGLVVGGVLLGVYKKGFPLFEKKWKRAALLFPFVLFGVGLLFDFSYGLTLHLLFTTFGVGVGLIRGEKVKMPSLRMRLCQVGCVYGGIVALFFASRTIPSLEIIWNFGSGYWLSYLGGNWLARRAE